MHIYIRRAASAFLCLSALVLTAACSDDENDAGGGGGGGGACGSLCSGAGFSGGDEQKFGDGKVVECQCTGTGTGVAKAACESYCSPFNVPAAKSSLSTKVTANDKCVCDGT